MSPQPESKIKLTVVIQPNAKKNEFIGVHGGALKFRIKAPPVEGKANEELIRFLSEVLEIPKSYINLLKGQTSKHKMIEILGLSREQIQFKLKIDSF